MATQRQGGKIGLNYGIDGRFRQSIVFLAQPKTKLEGQKNKHFATSSADSYIKTQSFGTSI